MSACGKNLAPFKDEQGWPTAGLRLEYPGYLAQDFRCLEWYGREMHLKHGPGTRRNVKFDDEEESLYLDVCLPGQEFWHKITPCEAKRYKDEIHGKRSTESRRLLETHDGPQNTNFQPLGQRLQGLAVSMRQHTEQERSTWSDERRGPVYVSPKPRR